MDFSFLISLLLKYLEAHPQEVEALVNAGLQYIVSESTKALEAAKAKS